MSNRARPVLCSFLIEWTKTAIFNRWRGLECGAAWIRCRPFCGFWHSWWIHAGITRNLTNENWKRTVFRCSKITPIQEFSPLTQHQEDPPQPVLSIKVTGKVCRELKTDKNKPTLMSSSKQVQFRKTKNSNVGMYPDYKDPFDEGEAKTWNGPVAASSWGGQTEREEETDPVEQESHWGKRNGALMSCFRETRQRRTNPETHWKRSAWRSRHCLSSAGRHLQSRPCSHSLHPGQTVESEETSRPPD